MVAVTPPPIVDTHVHLYDTLRPQGVPYPAKGSEPALPARYQPIAERNQIVAAIKVEASPWFDDNQWVLQVIEPAPLFVGMIGMLDPDQPAFVEHLDRFTKSPLFLGIRYGNLWERNLVTAVDNPAFVAGMREVAARKLTLDTANPRPELIHALVKLTDQIPDLRIMIDHLPALVLPTDAGELATYRGHLRQLRGRNVFVKVSMVVRRQDGELQLDPDAYTETLDSIYEIFGEDRVVYGSDWPNSAGNWLDYEQALGLVQPYFLKKGPQVAEKYFWRNSLAAYRWKPRTAAQRALLARP